MKGILVTIGAISFILVAIFSTIMWYSFNKNCGDYLKLAADAPSIKLADKFLGKALNYIEENNLTEGNSAFIFHTPSADVGIWYNQIRGAKETTSGIINRIQKDSTSVTQLEMDNALMKIREVVMDAGEKGISITKPTKIIYYPHQWAMLIWWILSALVLGIGILIAMSDN